MPMKKILAFLLVVFSGLSHATDIQLTWQAALDRVDGSQITQLDGYNIYHSVDNVVQPVITATGTSYLLTDVAKGSHTFQISAVEAGLEGEKSDPVNVSVDISRPVKIELTVRVVE